MPWTDEMTTLMLAEFDAETRFQARALRGHNTPISEGFRLLAKARGEEMLHEPTREYGVSEKGKKDQA